MTIEEYRAKLAQIDIQAAADKNKAAIQYANENNHVKVADVVEDHIGKVLVDKIKVSYGLTDIPRCVYFGVELKKDGKPTKRRTRRGVYQQNLLTKEI